MTIEITNQGIVGQQTAHSEQTKSGAADKHSNQSQLESGKPVETTVKVSDNGQRINAAIQAGTELARKAPVVDTKRVEATIAKVKNRSLDALGNAEQRLASAERIAERLLELDNELPPPKDFDEA